MKNAKVHFIKVYFGNLYIYILFVEKSELPFFLLSLLSMGGKESILIE